MPHPLDRLAGVAVVAGALLMLCGAALWAAAGLDLWAALDADDVAGYLAASATVRPLLVANLSLWMVGVLVLGVAGEALTGWCRRRPGLAAVAAVCFRTAVPLALVAFLAMLAIVVRGDGPSAAAAELVGWLGARADDVATALIAGVGPCAVSLAARDEWAPAWLVRWGVAAGAAGLLVVPALLVPGLTSLALVVVPVGMGWMLATGWTLLRRPAPAATVAPAAAP